MANLLLLGAGPNQIPAIEEAHKLGFKVCVLNGNPNAVRFEMADWHEQINIKDPFEVADFAKTFNQVHGLNGCMTLGVECAPSVGLVVDTLHLPGIGMGTAVNMTKKKRRYRSLRNMGYTHVAIPFWLDENFETWDRFPCVLKTKDDGSAADGVYYVENKERLEAHKPFGEGWFVEEYIDGHELSTESIVYNQHNHIDFIVDRNYDKKMKYKPYMIEDGCSMPSKISSALAAKVRQTIERIIACFGLSNCILKCDLVIKDNNVYVLECVPRLSGGRMCSHIIQPCTGYNLVRIAIGFAMGEHRYTPGPHIETPVAQRYYFPPDKEIKSHRDRGPDFIAQGVTVDEAIEKAERLVEEYGRSRELSLPNL